MMRDDFLNPEKDEDTDKASKARISVLKNGLIFNESRYEFEETFVPSKIDDPMGLDIHTTPELIEHLKKYPKTQLEARVLGTHSNGRARVKLNREQFLAASKQRDSKRLREAGNRFREDFEDFDNFDNIGNFGAFDTQIGRDFLPLLGGPFNKQLYYRDYLRMISASFFAYHHDPLARDIVNIIVDFTLARGFTLHADNPKAQLVWDAFTKANQFHTQFEHACSEKAIYGESMWWKLPNNQARISFNPAAGEKVPKAIIPRIRLIDPSNIAEIITVPEDPIIGVMYYVWLAPTQYQMWTRDGQPSQKFIYTQIPAEQVRHFRINSVSNEKRGRSDYFPSLGYMKRLRDSVNYAVVADQKAAAWCIDTTIQGNLQDINAYIADQQKQGQIPTAGSEFVHTEAIKREYLGNTIGGAKESGSFNWCLNMACMSAGIPVSYLGTHLSGTGTRASALVSTEPVAKRFERRRLVYTRELDDIFQWVMADFGIESECEIIFPELITQDRSAKLKDLGFMQSQGWLAPSSAAEMANKEIDRKDFDYAQELEQIKKDDEALGFSPGELDPLTAPGKGGDTGGGSKTSGLTSGDKTDIKKNLSTL